MYPVPDEVYHEIMQLFCLWLKQEVIDKNTEAKP